MEYVIIFIVVSALVLWVKGKSSGESKTIPIPHDTSDPNLQKEMRRLYEELDGIKYKAFEEFLNEIKVDGFDDKFSHPQLDTYVGETHSILVALDMALEPEFQKPPEIQRLLIQVGKDILEKWKMEYEQYEFDSLAERQRIEKATCKHMDVLSRKYRQCAYVDEYATIELAGFENEILHFLNRTLPDIDPEAAIEIVLELVQQEVDLKDSDEGFEFSPEMTPYEFEIYCGEILKNGSWVVQQVGGSGDQGCDLVIAKEGIKGVIQCKLYSSPVGNKAVQEVYSGKEWEDADFAVVVTNSSYTKSAKQLAAKNSVHLLHHEDLPRLSEIIDIGNQSTDLDDGGLERLSNPTKYITDLSNLLNEKLPGIIEQTKNEIIVRENAFLDVGEDADDVREVLTKLHEMNETSQEILDKAKILTQAVSSIDSSDIVKVTQEIRDLVDGVSQIQNDLSINLQDTAAAFSSSLDDVTKAHSILNGFATWNTNLGNLFPDTRELIEKNDAYSDLATTCRAALSDNRFDDQDDKEVDRVAEAKGLSEDVIQEVISICFYEHVMQEFWLKMIEEKSFSPRQENKLKQIHDDLGVTLEQVGVLKEIIEICRENWKRENT